MKRHSVWSASCLIAALMLAAVVPVAPAAGQAVEGYAVPQADLYSDAPATGDRYGAAVAVFGNTAVVGAPEADEVTGLLDCGKVYVYLRAGEAWALQEVLSAPVPQAGAQFGKSVAITDNTIVVGEPYRDGVGEDIGAAYVFERTGTDWNTSMTLAPDSATEFDWFGMGVDIDEDANTIVVGMPNDDREASNAGAAFVFQKAMVAPWGMDDVLVDAAGAVDDRLGTCVAISGDTIITGVGGDDNGGYTDSGKAIVWEYTAPNWNPTATLFASSQTDGDFFGGPIALEGNTAVIGAVSKDVGGVTDAGEVFLFEDPGTGWSLMREMHALTPTSQEMYGSGIALSGDRILIGAFWGDSHTGIAYSWLHEGTSWVRQQTIGMKGHYPYVTHFGTSVALDGITAVVGGALSDAYTPSYSVVDEAGAAYVYTYTGALVAGTCTDAVTGLPLAGVEVGAYYPDGFGDPNLEQYVTSGADGVYWLAVKPDTYSIGYMGPSSDYEPGWYDHKALWPDSDEITLATGQLMGIDFAVMPKTKVYRFYNFTNGTHFFTASAAERDHVIVTWPHIFTYEGVAYLTSPSHDLTPLFRFYNVVSKSHFYTADAAERDDVIRRLSHIYNYDGPAYPVSRAKTNGQMAVYRFYNLRNGSHFYTADEAEMMNVRNTLGYLYQYEGPAFWVTQ